jgi:DNA-binding transcriptional ArsR family regulator
MDDLAMDIHDYLLEIATEYEGLKFVLIPITEVVKKFERNHRTIQRRISALKEAGLITPVIKKNTITMYRVVEQEDQP